MGKKTECTGLLARTTIKPESKAGLDKTEGRYKEIGNERTERKERSFLTSERATSRHPIPSRAFRADP